VFSKVNYQVSLAGSYGVEFFSPPPPRNQNSLKICQPFSCKSSYFQSDVTLSRLSGLE